MYLYPYVVPIPIHTTLSIQVSSHWMIECIDFESNKYQSKEKLLFVICT